MFSSRIRVAMLAPVAAVSLGACGVNTIATAEEVAQARWADVQNQYQRRADLIPNLVASVQGAAAQERNVLREVTEARANATRIQLSPEQLRDPEAMRAFSEAQGRLTTAIIPLQRLQEAYPQLQTNQNFLALQSQLEGTENRIAVSRRDYIEAVRRYNTEIKTIPGRWWNALMYQSEPMANFTVAEEVLDAPEVKF